MDIQVLRNKYAAHRPTLLDVRARYAVLVPLVEKDGKLHLLYEVRAAHMRRQPGEVCFPGGRMEPGEEPIACALRETMEELGIAPEHIEILGKLDFLYLRSNSLMYPVLALLDSAEHLTYSPDEVADTFLVSLDWLRDNPPDIYRYDLTPHPEDFPYADVGIRPDYRWAPEPMEVPVYRGLPYPLWGLTARISRHIAQSIE